MKNFWDERYSTEEYAYGEKPNQFLVDQLSRISPGKILFPAEGEGRNAVYAATLNWKVTAFDPSIEGQRKAFQLAEKYGVNIDYQLMNYETANFPENSFDCLVLVFAHVHSENRAKYHQKLISYLKPGGHLILEAFNKDQINKTTGGPKDIDMLFSANELRNDFAGFGQLKIEETETLLDEGSFHRGKASVIRVSGIK